MGCQGSKSAGVADSSPLTEDSKCKLRESWDKFTSDENFSANSCYIFFKLFEMAPQSKELFHFVDDVSEEALQNNERLQNHARRVTDALSIVMTSLDDSYAVSQAVKGLGGRHVGYMVKESYVMHVLKGLCCTLEKALQDEFTKEHKKAWTIFIKHINQLFVQGMKEHGMK